MADPVGLADLGFRGVGKALKHGFNIRERRHDIKALALAHDQARETLRASDSSSDAYETHKDILTPLLQETSLFLDVVDARKRFKSLDGRYIRPGRDSITARRLLEEFKAVPDKIQTRTEIMRQALSSETQLQTLAQVQKDIRSMQSRLRRQALSSETQLQTLAQDQKDIYSMQSRFNILAIILPPLFLARE
ncbi:hypothetical protein EXIGLDRAFT_751275 [Exidia glandulosa HHB12029]|uniref:Uncharacterized protein n=1 Tax=Exidia glandulosa HHB12029 TaxID=1314781 RepID=A0A165FLE7_EXIGL|nr:hypothetical protein EXIGLDRAFT_751275 [Exidia glandulosa HHB12029]